MTVDPKKVKRNDLMAFVYWGTIDSASRLGDRVSVSDVDRGEGFSVNGSPLVESAFSADRYDEVQKVTKTRAAELLVNAYNRPFTVVFEKKEGEERTLRGRLIQPEPLLGRSMVEDLDIKADKHRLRQVDHRTIKSLIVDNVMYVVK